MGRSQTPPKTLKNASLAIILPQNLCLFMPKSSVKPGEIDPTTGGTVIDLKPKNSKPIHKTLAQLEAEGVKVSETAVVE